MHLPYFSKRTIIWKYFVTIYKSVCVFKEGQLGIVFSAMEKHFLHSKAFAIFKYFQLLVVYQEKERSKLEQFCCTYAFEN